MKTGKVHGKTAARHSSDELVNFLGQVVSQCQPKQKVNIIVDNLSAHKTKNVSDFLESHPEVKLQFTPTYSSWLNQVEIWFARIERDVIARGIFTSVKDLSRKLLLHPGKQQNGATFSVEVFRYQKRNQAMLTNSPRQTTRTV